MKPSARIQAGIELLEKITENTRVPMDTIVGDYMRNRRYIGSKDRAALAERVYDMIRAHARLGWWLEHEKVADTARNRMIAWLALADNTGQSRFKDLFDGSQYAPNTLNDNELERAKALAAQSLSHPDMPIDIRVECPKNYAQKLKDYFGDDFKAEMTAMLEPATLDLRVNTFLIDREKAKASLEKDGVESDETTRSPWGLRCKFKAFLSRTTAFKKGFVEIQDEGSQLIAHICGAKPGMQVLDFCAGGGGKTLALASAMQRKGRIVAADTDEKRLARGKMRYKKAGLADIIEPRPLSEERHRKWLRRQKGTFDLTLIDVPCSGTGTWRRNPDMRWTHYGPLLEELTQIQSEIFDKAAKTVKPGGRLVYATCSLLPEENEEQIKAFLARNDEFEVQPLDETLGLGTPYMRLTPHRHGTDGFFAAVLVRKSA